MGGQLQVYGSQVEQILSEGCQFFLLAVKVDFDKKKLLSMKAILKFNGFHLI